MSCAVLPARDRDEEPMEKTLYRFKSSPRFMFLSRSFNYSSRLLSIGAKVAVNQLCFTPVFNSYFFGAQALPSGDSLADTSERIKKTVPVSFVNSCKLWPAVTAFSFAFVPIEYRSIFAGVVAVGWQTYLSFLNREAEMEEAREKAAAGVKPALAAAERVEAMVLNSQAGVKSEFRREDRAHRKREGYREKLWTLSTVFIPTSSQVSMLLGLTALSARRPSPGQSGTSPDTITLPRAEQAVVGGFRGHKQYAPVRRQE
ncbi:Uu.00g136860.m01.CDS01 [Anthostomella pinea]|uniref:Uu.00g136860.m01.CDS01 n=1 Tax=Anthostomella pinea TaxID=933095 RepID=A0AAI8VPG7_9PEZI|nr:Uu.00g136860.m01.CDS01 [Anthostomella pinea]